MKKIVKSFKHALLGMAIVVFLLSSSMIGAIKSEMAMPTRSNCHVGDACSVYTDEWEYIGSGTCGWNYGYQCGCDIGFGAISTEDGINECAAS